MQAALLANAKPAWRPGGGEARLETEGVVSRLIGSGWVRTSRAYLDATVELEFRAVGPESDGAVLLRAVLPRPGARPVSGYLVSIGAGDKLTVKTLDKRALRATSADARVAAGEWHRLTIRAVRDHVSVTLDGEEVATVEGREHQAGYIGLEVRRGTMEFRRIRIVPPEDLICRDGTASGATTAVIAAAPDVQLPRVRREVKPRYTIEAMSDKAQGAVWVEAVIMPDGRVGDTCVRRSIHPDLDAEALAASRQWTFTPSQRGGVPVPVLVTIELTFTLE
jgi:TonB family protein